MSLPLTFALLMVATPGGDLWTVTGTAAPPGPEADRATRTATTTTLDIPAPSDAPQIPNVRPDEPPARQPLEAEAELPGAPRLDTIEPPAPPPPPPPSPPKLPNGRRPLPEDQHVWYGWQNIIVSGAGIIAALVAIPTKSVVLGYSGITLYACGPPAVHWAHGNFEMGFASLGLQIGTPVVTLLGAGYLALIASASSGGDNDAGTGVIVGATVVGALVSMAVDAFVLAWITDEDLSIVPTVNVSADNRSIGIGGTF